MGLKEHLPNFGHLDKHTKTPCIGYEIFYEDIKKDMSLKRMSLKRTIIPYASLYFFENMGNLCPRGFSGLLNTNL